MAEPITPPRSGPSRASAVKFCASDPAHFVRYGKAAIGTADTPAEPIRVDFVLTAQVQQLRHQHPGRRPDTERNHPQQQNAQRPAVAGTCPPPASRPPTARGKW